VKLEQSDPASKGAETIRYPVADLDGKLIWAQDYSETAERPKGFRCVGCQGALTLRAGPKRRPHFSHRTNETCSGGETALHRTTIRVISAALEKAIREGRPYPFELSCRSCDANRPGNLARAASSTVEVDRVLSNGIRPDLLIRDRDGVPQIAIEVIVTHAPDEGALIEYNAHNLLVLAVYPTWDSLELMREGLLHLSTTAAQGARTELMGRCPFARHLSSEDGALQTCSKCEAISRVVTVEVSEGHCWKSQCSQVVRALDIYARIDGRRYLVAAGAGDLRNVAEIATEVGVILQHRSSKMAGVSYLMNICSCGAHSGDNFIYGGFASESWTPSMSEPVRRFEVCANGHWVQREVRRWHPETRAGRAQSATGLTGESAGLFGDGPEEPLISFTSFASPDDLSRFLSRRFR
jgi:hypothetical protein